MEKLDDGNAAVLPWCKYFAHIGSTSFEGYVSDVESLEALIKSYEDHYGVTFVKRDTRGTYGRTEIGKSYLL